MTAMTPYPYAYIRGKIVPIEQASVSIMTNSLQYGAGVFAGIKAYQMGGGMGIFRLDEHITRLRNSARTLRFPFETDAPVIRKAILDLATANRLTGTTYIRPLIYRSDLDIVPGITGDYDLAIYMIGMPEFVPADKGMDVCVSSWQRNADNALPPRTKATGGYLNSSLAIHDAKQAGFDSAILLDASGNVGEGAVMNLFLVRNGTLMTPGLDNDILEGITRRTLIELASELSIPIAERSIGRSELYTADELFFCGTAVEIAWCKSVDRVKISAKCGEITSKLRAAWATLPQTHPHLYTMIHK